MTTHTTCDHVAGREAAVPHGPLLGGGGGGAVGVPDAVFDAGDSLPAASTAVTRYVYRVPLVSPVSV
jgi:hypothetical protein